MTFRTLLRLHRYAGLITAPLILFFAISGIWQVFRLHEDQKNGRRAPQRLKTLSNFHKAEDVNGKPGALPFQYAVSTAAGVLVLGTLLGLMAAFRLTRPTWLAVLLMVLGTAIPLLLYLLVG
ncbi:MAG TPA: hypothetical protein VER58_17225 [Thermoanaerobaculia bacterium]|nr:hypothetical protein [Thermoanaerobaculia bacterium]